MKSFTVGRGNNADIVIDDISISRIHLAVEIISADKLELQDLNSTNGSVLVTKTGSINLAVKQVANSSDSVLLGNYKISVAELLVLFAQTTQQNNQPKKSQSDEPFSRYIRTEDGTFVRKT